jgi:hypothetical protein
VTKSSVVRFFLLMGLMLAVNSVARAQLATGTPPFGSFSGGPDVIDNANLNIMIDVPIRHKAGRGIPFAYDLVYNSLLWNPVSVSGVQTWQPANSFGWTAQTGALTGFVTSTSTVTTCTYDGPGGTIDRSTQTFYSNYVYHDSYGIPHAYGL